MSETLVSAWTRARRALEAAGVDSPVNDARLFLEAAAGVARLDIVTDPQRPLADDALARLDAYVARRVAREPTAYILGRQGFWKIELEVDPAVLIPRPETEALTHAGLGLLGAAAAPRVLDFGVGSGAVLFSILDERFAASGVGVDASEAALAVARRNAERLGLADRVELRLGDWGAGLDGPFDLVVSNPPYVAQGEIPGLQPEVQREPISALDGGPDGLDAYRRLLPDVLRLLRPGGGWALEVGKGQDRDVASLAEGAGLLVQAVVKDLSGVDRVVLGRKP